MDTALWLLIVAYPVVRLLTTWFALAARPEWIGVCSSFIRDRIYGLGMVHPARLRATLQFAEAMITCDQFVSAKVAAACYAGWLGIVIFVWVAGPGEIHALLGNGVAPGTSALGVIELILWALALCFLFGVAGWFLPDRWLTISVRARKSGINERFPRFLRLIIMTMRVGAEFERAVEAVAGSLSGPLGRQLLKMDIERRLGIPRSQYAERFSWRVLGWEEAEQSLDQFKSEFVKPSALQTEIASLGASVTRAGELGTSLVDSLDRLADRIERTRALDAVEKGKRDTVALVFPLAIVGLAVLVLLVLPTLTSIRTNIGIFSH